MKNLTSKLQTQFNLMCESGKLFRVELSGREIWDLYLTSFTQDVKFRDPKSSKHNCNHCNNFIRRYGNIVTVDEHNQLTTIWDVVTDQEYTPVVNALSQAIKNSKISEVFFESYDSLNKLNYEKCNKTNDFFKLGVVVNHKQYNKAEAEMYGVVSEGEVRAFNHLAFNHLALDLPKLFVDQSNKSIEAIQGGYRDAKNVFERAMVEISLDTLNLVKDLSNQGSLLDGQTHLYKIEQFIPLKQAYDNIPQDQRDNWCWVNSYNLPFAKFKNELIGVLCSELSEGEELNKACQSWNKRVDPANYMKVTAPITQRQIEEAKTFVQDNNYTESFDRRFATMDDIKVTEILHSNVGKATIPTVSIFDSVKSTKSQHKRNQFEGIEEVSIDKFMTDILPTCTSAEAYLENRLEGNMVSLTTTNIPDSKPIFKWSNNYSWTFNGNLAGKSQIKEAVKTAGGKVDGVLRFSIMWADGNEDNSDLDAHCIESSGTEIYYGNKVSGYTYGNLDIDITRPDGKLAVENITYPLLSQMKNGTYKFLVNQFAARNSKGFKAEIEFDGELYSYSYDRAVSGNIDVAEITLNNGVFSIVHKLPATYGVGVTKEIYGLETNQFHKVKLVSLSPNHWGENNVGNKHYLFMLDGCKATTSIRSFHNENLNADLIQHKKVMEVLGSANMIESTDNQLSGLGMNATVSDYLILKLQGSFKRTIKVKF